MNRRGFLASICGVVVAGWQGLTSTPVLTLSEVVDRMHPGKTVFLSASGAWRVDTRIRFNRCYGNGGYGIYVSPMN